MRSVNKGGNPSTYAPPRRLSFKATVIEDIFGTKSPTLEECLDLWLEVAKNATISPKPADWSDKKSAKKLIEQRVTKIYKQAAVPLVQHIGPFCSYCESPVTGSLEVEHVAPKAEYPTYAANWDNFLIACNPCNQPKGKNPTRTTVAGWLATTNPGERDYYDEIRQRYVWPDLDSESFRKLPADLWYEDPATGWQPVPIADAVDLDNTIVLVDIATRTVIADLYLTQGKFSNVRVEVRLSDNTTNGDGTEMIDLCQLNTTGNLANTYDRRVINRTKAWFTVLKSLRFITAVQQAPPPRQQSLFDQIWSSICLAASHIGFYSIWVRILGQYHDPSGNRLDHRFVQDTNVPLHFPNTNTVNLP